MHIITLYMCAKAHFHLVQQVVAGAFGVALQIRLLRDSWFVAFLCLCASNNLCVCVQVETRASKHSLFTHNRVEQQLTVCVHK